MIEKVILDGKKYALELQANLTEEVSKMDKKPVLATILVGDDSSSEMYIKMKVKKAKEIGIEVKEIRLQENIPFKDLELAIYSLNKDPNISGIMLQHPLPMRFNEADFFDLIDPNKDVDGLNRISFGAMAFKEKVKYFHSATPLAVVDLLKYYKIPIAGKNVVIVGRSRILGKPLALMMLNEDATITVCHSKTANLEEITRKADILVAAMGMPLYIKKNMIKEGVVLVDCGYNKGNLGDIDLNGCIPICSAYTPVPGGVGPVTIMKLLEQVVMAKKGKI